MEFLTQNEWCELLRGVRNWARNVKKEEKLSQKSHIIEKRCRKFGQENLKKSGNLPKPGRQKGAGAARGSRGAQKGARARKRDQGKKKGSIASAILPFIVDLIRKVIKITLNVNDRSTLVSGTACQVAKRTDEVCELSRCRTLRSHVTYEVCIFFFDTL